MSTEPRKRCGHRGNCNCHYCYYCDLILPGGWSKKRGGLFGMAAYYEEAEVLCQHMREAHPLADRVNVQIWRWLYAPPSYRVLHRIVEMTWNMDDEAEGEYGVRSCVGRAACGFVPKAGENTPQGWFAIPGIFSRMGLPRCAKCCAKVGVPRGDGTPWNDKALREAGLGDL